MRDGREQTPPQRKGHAKWLAARMLRRSRYLAMIMAIVHQPRVETRLHMLLRHLADRCGTVRSDGVIIPMRLTRAIWRTCSPRAARRSAALGALQKQGLISPSTDGWILRGGPPGGLPAIAEPG